MSCPACIEKKPKGNEHNIECVDHRTPEYVRARAVVEAAVEERQAKLDEDRIDMLSGAFAGAIAARQASPDTSSLQFFLWQMGNIDGFMGSHP